MSLKFVLKALAVFGTMTSAAMAAPAPSSTAAAGSYSLVADYSGASFFDNFYPFTGPDPTAGSVQYLSMADAVKQKLVGYIYDASTNTSNAYIGVDYQSVTANRPSVRLSSRDTFDAGSLVVFDVHHAPVAYGSWPALWMLGDETTGSQVWPYNGGEIDVMEWVHKTDYNAATLHTGLGCDVQNNSQTFQGNLQSTNCSSGDTLGSTGCSIPAEPYCKIAKESGAHNKVTANSQLATAGDAFNKQGGGVYAMDWTTSGVKVYLFARGNLPADLVAGKPNPATWTTKPLASFSGAGCDYTKSLSSMQILVDQTFCGQWAGLDNVWAASGAPNATGQSCGDYVKNNPAEFKDAYFEIASIKAYGSEGVKPKTAISAPTKREESVFEIPTIDLQARYEPQGNNVTFHHAHTHGHGHGHVHGEYNATDCGHHGNASAPAGTNVNSTAPPSPPFMNGTTFPYPTTHNCTNGTRSSNMTVPVGGPSWSPKYGDKVVLPRNVSSEASLWARNVSSEASLWA